MGGIDSVAIALSGISNVLLVNLSSMDGVDDLRDYIIHQHLLFVKAIQDASFCDNYLCHHAGDMND